MRISRKLFVRFMKVLAVGALMVSMASLLGTTAVRAAASNVVSTDQIPTIPAPPPAPPEGFNPVTASQQDLTIYGFPERPTDPAALRAWTNAMQHVKYYVPPQQKPSNSYRGLAGTSYSSNWAGYVDLASNNKNNGNSIKYYSVSGSWIQPSFNTSGNSADPAFWVGMDGQTSSDVVQAGADSGATNDGGPTQYVFWIENYPNPLIWELTPVVHANDQLYVSVTYYSTSASSSVLLNNQTTGQYTTVTLPTPFYTGDSAEYIYEAVNNIYYDWGSTYFSNGSLNWKDSTGATGGGAFEAYNYTKDIMTNTGSSSGTVEGEPSAPGTHVDGFDIASHKISP